MDGPRSLVEGGTFKEKFRGNKMTDDEILSRFPKVRTPLPPEYVEIYERHYSENRNAATNASKASNAMESWGHRKVAKTAKSGGVTLEIGAGTLNQLDFEDVGRGYDIVEPKHELFERTSYIGQIRDVYDDIRDVPDEKMYDRITSCCTFEHIEDLPEVLLIAGRHMKEKGVLSISIPNEGRFLWHFAYSNTTGREFRRRYGLDYEVIMHYVHCNTADEIEQLLRYYFRDVKESLFGISKTFAFYRYYECREPILRRNQ